MSLKSPGNKKKKFFPLPPSSLGFWPEQPSLAQLNSPSWPLNLPPVFSFGPAQAERAQARSSSHQLARSFLPLSLSWAEARKRSSASFPLCR